METSEYLLYLKPSKRQKRRDKRLHEELIECRRHSGGKINKKSRRKGQKRMRQRQAITGYPYREPMRTRVGNHSYPSDNLNPLIRWLQTNSGRPWDQVYSDLIRQLDTRMVLGLHVIDHLWDLVDIHAKLVDGKVTYPSRYELHCSGGVCVRRLVKEHKWFFVHPETGMLHSNRYELQKGPFPKKARWKLEKAKRMRAGKKKKKHRPRKVKSKELSYPLAPIQTKDQRLQTGKEYILMTPAFQARVRLLSVYSNDRYGLYISLGILILACSLHFMEGMKDRLFYRDEMGEPRWMLYSP